MKNSIIGTAGHVDHGKTLLIKALTGMDTDRLKEEKKRGITIELGFAYLDLPGGGKAGIIDVPGHEKFVKNMLAGVGGMDLVLLVVAADEGVMPQTREHLDILSLLDIKEGIIVLTKTDMVDADWLAMVKEEVRAEVQGTFLQGAPVACVSSYTGEGIEALRQLIFETLGRVGQKSENTPMRQPVDRVFSVDGFGTVITGTLMEGTVREGDEVTIYPAGLPAKVRNLQVHSQTVKQAFAGQRVAVNLAGIKKEEVKRGDYLAAPGSLQGSLMLDVKLNILPHCERQIQNGSRLHFYHGAGDSLCKLVLLDRDALQKGEAAYAQLRFIEPVVVKNQDRFVVRFYSPIETVGGGMVLDCLPQRHKRFDQTVLEGLQIKESGTAERRILQRFLEEGPRFSSSQTVFDGLRVSREEFDGAVQGFLQSGQLVQVTAKVLLHRDWMEQLGQKLTAVLEEYHRQNPLQPGMRKEELRSKFLPRQQVALADSILAEFERRGLIGQRDQRVWREGFSVQYSPAQRQLFEQIGNQFSQSGIEPPGLDEIKSQYAKNKELKAVLDALFDTGELVALTPQIAIHRDACQKAQVMLEAYCRENGAISLAQFRDLAGTSRKYALALLEYFDHKGLTRKSGEMRVLTGK
ncbi:MAG: selenocysteine-specific translation elongation factor [Oscillospiraceae bacterium]|nr:selenocysteine-specific translation elongation factor [Oscillospiraceae bacterium]